MSDVDNLQDVAYAICKQRGWDRDWRAGGVYLHLEVSEFIESLRGKGESNTYKKAADILFVLLSTLAHHEIRASEVLDELSCIITDLQRGKGGRWGNE